MQKNYENYEYRESRTHKGVKRALTERLVLLKVEREKIIKAVEEELGGLIFPSLYLLVNERDKKLYIGETGDTAKRLKGHVNNPPEELGEWDYGVIIWDGRPLINSIIFSEASLRTRLEYELITAFTSKGSRYTPVNRVKAEPKLSVYQIARAETLLPELLYMLHKFDMIPRHILEFSEERKRFRQRVISEDELKAILESMKHRVEKIDRAKKTLLLDGKQAFYRPGSEKPRGWQITIRGSWKDFIEKTQEPGFLIINRGDGYMIPLEILRKNFLSIMKGQDTLDIYVDITSEGARIIAPDPTIDISEFKLSKRG